MQQLIAISPYRALTHPNLDIAVEELAQGKIDIFCIVYACCDG